MHFSKATGSKILGLGLIAGIISVTAFAEPSIQPSETLESLSKAKISTTVNGQPGSIQELVASGKIKILDSSTPKNEEAPASEVATPDAVADKNSLSDMPMQEDVPTSKAVTPEIPAN